MKKTQHALTDSSAALQASHPPGQPLLTKHKLTLTEAATGTLLDLWGLFTAQLHALRTSEDPEVVHQARVAWRRFKSAVRLFKPVLNADTRPAWLPLQGLLTALSELRELDVASTETLPALQHAFTANDAHRANQWLAMTRTLHQAQASKRQAVQQALQDPGLDAALRDITQWLEGASAVCAPGAQTREPHANLQRWARQRLGRLHEQLKRTLKAPITPDSQHQTRIAAKRQRYAIETLRPLLPKQRAQRWHEQAVALQNSLGAQRDVLMAGALLGQLRADRGLVAFLRGVAVGRQH